MKAKGLKIISLVAVLAMLILFVGCDSTQITADPTSNESIQGEGENPYCLEIESIEAYNTFIQTSQSLPDYFVTWDMLKDLGTFTSLRVYKNTDYFRYNYDFYLENGGRLQLKVNPYGAYTDNTDIPQISAADIGDTMTNLSSGNSTRLVRYENGGLKYYYGEGRLAYIEWAVSGNCFYLANTSQTRLRDLAGYNPNTVLGKLLSTDPETQLSALNELKAAIENN